MVTRKSAAGLRPVKVQVYSIKRVGRSKKGNTIWELATSQGSFRTAASSILGPQLSAKVQGQPVPMTLMVNSRGTVSGLN